MPKQLSIDFESCTVDAPQGPTEFVTDVYTDGFRVTAGVSLGRQGFTLSAHATMLRQTVTIYVVGQPSADAATPDIENHRYRVAVRLDPGTYQVRLKHGFRLEDDAGWTIPFLVHETSVVIGNGTSGSLDAAETEPRALRRRGLRSPARRDA